MSALTNNQSYFILYFKMPYYYIVVSNMNVIMSLLKFEYGVRKVKKYNLLITHVSNFLTSLLTYLKVSWNTLREIGNTEKL